jgi:DNA mismatch endonuclease (patch repair protein)
MKRMRRQGKRDTKPETLLRKQLQGRGLRYRINAKPIPDLRRTADLVFRQSKIAVFVDGCFWHGCPEHSRPTKSHTKWWAEKIDANRRRDAETTALLEQAGWAVLRVWEHEDPATAADRVEAAVRDALEPLPRVA